MDDAALTVDGRDVLFAHWPIAPDALRPNVPDALALDVRDGRAWVSALAHRIVGVRPRGLPSVGPLSRSFPQLNFRTYVRHGDRRGVYFLACETGAALGATVARRAFGLPFHRADVRLTERGGWFRFRSRRTAPAGDVRFDARYRPAGETPPAPVEAGSLASFLVERSRWFVVDGGVRTGTIDRDPWRVAPADATLPTNTLFDAVPAASQAPVPDSAVGEARYHYSPGFEIAASQPRESQTAIPPEP